MKLLLPDEYEQASNIDRSSRVAHRILTSVNNTRRANSSMMGTNNRHQSVFIED